MDEAGEPWSQGATGHGGAQRQGFPVDPHRLQRALWGTRFWLTGPGGLGLLFGPNWVAVFELLLVLGLLWRSGFFCGLFGGLVGGLSESARRNAKRERQGGDGGGECCSDSHDLLLKR